MQQPTDGMPITLYSLPEGPPSVAVRQCLKVLNLNYELVNVDFASGKHMTDEYAKIRLYRCVKNPQKQIPVLDDNGFYLSESNAILQYLVDKYGENDILYPRNLQARAIVNHRLCFNQSTYYHHIGDHACEPIFFDYPRTPLSLKKVHIALDNFNTYLQRLGTKYAAADNVTIADFQLVSATMCLEAIDFDFSSYELVTKWYETYKKENPELWAIVEEAMKKLSKFEKNPPDLSHMDHPIHPIKRN